MIRAVDSTIVTTKGSVGTGGKVSERKTLLRAFTLIEVVVMSAVGMMLMAMASDLIVIFLALELLSIPLYILAGFARPRPESEEAAMKSPIKMMLPLVGCIFPTIMIVLLGPAIIRAVKIFSGGEE